jgi:hypothetical protein
MDRRFFLSLSAFGAASLTSRAAEAKALTVEQALIGKLAGRGRFTAPLGGVDRSFEVTLNGRKQGDLLIIPEVIRFEDGEVQRYTWRIRPTGPGRWSGTREDVIGKADITESNGKVRLRYTVDYKTGDSVQRLDFDDLIWLRSDGKLVNEASVKRFGITIGNVRIVLERV